MKVKKQYILTFTLFSLLIPMPWFLFSFINTGNPFYPFFSEIYKIEADINIFNLVNFIRSPDPISPIYLILFPIIFFVYKKLNFKERLVLFYCGLAFIIWLITPQTGGGRFIMPYLPIFSLLVTIILNNTGNRLIKRAVLASVVLVALSTIGYRGISNAKFVPVIFGLEQKQSFLLRNLNFEYGDFYDTNERVKGLVNGKTVLVVGGHNLYYADFSFLHESWLKDADSFEYVLTQSKDLSEKFANWKLIYENEKTNTKLYSK